MTEPDLIRLFIEPLERLDVSYMVTGGVASVVYGDPRFTRDVDVVMELDPAQLEDFTSAFAGGSFYVPPDQVLQREVGREEGGHFNLIHRETGLRADIYLAGRDPLHAWALARRERISVEGFSIWLAPVEYVILRKLEYYRDSGSDRHLRDVEMMLRISGDAVDPGSLRQWSRRMEIEEQLEEARRSEPD